eukprot:1382368-Karenia_brevis.AAC.1
MPGVHRTEQREADKAYCGQAARVGSAGKGTDLLSQKIWQKPTTFQWCCRRIGWQAQRPSTQEAHC